MRHVSVTIDMYDPEIEGQSIATEVRASGGASTIEVLGLLDVGRQQFLASKTTPGPTVYGAETPDEQLQ